MLTINFITNNGNTDWFDVEGEIFGVNTTDLSIMDEDGLPHTDDFVEQEWEIVDELRELVLYRNELITDYKTVITLH